MSSSLGKLGEAYAAAYLTQLGYRLVAANFTLPVGRNLRGAVVNAEIDLVAYDDDVLCFVEVKTRGSEQFAGPLANVNLRKQRQITRTAQVYKQTFGVTEMKHRFDVVTVLAEKGTTPKLELIRGFWTEAKFKKRSWGEIPY